jgi:hypothetical protein
MAITPFNIGVRNLVIQYDKIRNPQVETSSWFESCKPFWLGKEDYIREILVDFVCPMPCRGYLDGDENWHQLCLDKVDQMMAVMND